MVIITFSSWIFLRGLLWYVEKNETKKRINWEDQPPSIGLSEGNQNMFLQIDDCFVGINSFLRCYSSLHMIPLWESIPFSNDRLRPLCTCYPAVHMFGFWDVSLFDGVFLNCVIPKITQITFLPPKNYTFLQGINDTSGLCQPKSSTNYTFSE